MAYRRPGIYSPTWLYQDFLCLDNGPEQLRYLQVKQDGEVFTRISQTFDYSDPPYVGAEQRGGQIVAQIDYTVNGFLVTIDSWFVNWRDEWPLRLASNYLKNCMYRQTQGYAIQVDKTAYPFWVSEQFSPFTNDPADFLYSRS